MALLIFSLNLCHLYVILSATKKGVLLVIPIVLAGSFALLLRNFPVPAYQEALAAFGAEAPRQAKTLLSG